MPQAKFYAIGHSNFKNFFNPYSNSENEVKRVYLISITLLAKEKKTYYLNNNLKITCTPIRSKTDSLKSTVVISEEFA